MKKCIYIAALFTFGLTLRAELPVVMHAPFEFAAGGKTLPAGDYHINELAPGVLLIAGEGSGSSVLAMAIAAGEGSTNPSVSFDRKGAEPVLVSVTTSTGTWRLTAPAPARAAAALRSKK